MPASRRTTLLAFAALLGAAPAVLAAPLGQRSGNGLGEERNVALRASASGTVVAIDAAQRQMTVRGKLGEATFALDPKVGALDAIKVGDAVGLDFVAAIGLRVRRSGEPRVTVDPPSPSAATAAARGGRITAAVRLLAIDPAGPKIRVQGPKGRVAEFPVQDKADLKGLRVGDLLVAVIYELVAVGVVPR